MNNSYTFPFITGIIYLFNMVLTNRDEVIQQYFKSGLSYNEIMSALSAYPNAYQYVRQFKRIFKNLVLSQRMLKSSVKHVLAFKIS